MHAMYANAENRTQYMYLTKQLLKLSALPITHTREVEVVRFELTVEHLVTALKAVAMDHYAIPL